MTTRNLGKVETATVSDGESQNNAFALYTIDEADRKVIRHETAAPPEHGRGVFPMWLRNKGVTTVLAGGMGPRASNIFTSHGIDVMIGAEGEDPETMVRSYLDGTPSFSGELCHDHGFHDCGHGPEILGGRRLTRRMR